MLHAGQQQAASSVLYTTSCKHSLVLLKMDEIIARNMLTCFKLLIKLLLHLVGFYTIVSMMHGHTNIKCFFWFSLHEMRRRSDEKLSAEGWRLVIFRTLRFVCQWHNNKTECRTSHMDFWHKMYIQFYRFSKNKSIKSSKCVILISKPHTHAHIDQPPLLHTHTHTCTHTGLVHLYYSTAMCMGVRICQLTRAPREQRQCISS